MSAIVQPVVQQHAEDASILYSTRSVLLRAPHVKLLHLRRTDDRLDAHLDGLAVAGEGANQTCEGLLETMPAGASFVLGTRALATRNAASLHRLIALADAVPESRQALAAAFGWSRSESLEGIVAQLLGSGTVAERWFGISACAMHRVDPGLAAGRLLEDPDERIRARAYRTAGELGKREFVSRLGALATGEEGSCRFWAAYSAVLLGDRQDALGSLLAASTGNGPMPSRARRLALLAAPMARANEYLRKLSTDPAQLRSLIQSAGLIGDPVCIQWLIRQMSDLKLARLAGESFSLVTGADLAWLDLERKPPEDFDAGPNDDPNDPNVAMDEDDSLPWPDVERIERWWAQNSSRFVPGQRYFVGAPVMREHCIEVLRTGYQRQRILAAHHLCLLEPGSVLFEWRAPAWRQAQALAALA